MSIFTLGKDMLIKKGTQTILGMGTLGVDGVSADALENTSFGQNWKTFDFGLLNGGNLSFSGYLAKDDSSGQMYIMDLNRTLAEVTDLYFYIDSTSKWGPNRTTGYLSPWRTSNGGTILTHVNITSVNIGAAVGGLSTFSATAQVSGCYVLD